MFEKKEERPKTIYINAKDVGLPYTVLSVTVHYVMQNGQEYTTTKKLYLLNYTSYSTAKEAMKKFFDDYLDIQNEYRKQIVKNFGKHEGYMRFEDTFVRNAQCVLAYITCTDNSYDVDMRMENTPNGMGWPWEANSYHAD